MNKFELEMMRAQQELAIDTNRVEYWHGFMRGLRRAHFGDNFGEPHEHKLWLSLIEDRDVSRKQRGEGYRDGLAALTLSQSATALGRKGGLVKSEAKAKTSAANGAKGGRPRKQP